MTDTTTKETAAVKILDKRIISADEYLQNGLPNEIDVMKTQDVLEIINNYYVVQD